MVLPHFEKICIFCTLLLCLLTGCSSNNQKEYPSVALLPGKGEVEAISLDQAIEMKENNESFLLIISQTYCTHCLEFFMESDPFTKEKGIKLWDVVLDDEKENKEQILVKIRDNFGEFSSTPSLYFVAENKVQSNLLSNETEINLKSYEEWLKELQIIK